MATGYFNVVIIFLWFWYDPQPSVAELVLPLLRAHAPPDRQPFVALLSDDAHAIRSSRLGEVEIHPSTRAAYNKRASNYWARQKHMYHLSNMGMYISAMDQVAEAESFPFLKYFRLLRSAPILEPSQPQHAHARGDAPPSPARMPIRAFRILSKMDSRMQDRSFAQTVNMGFIGNGLTPTNHLGIQWFLEHCWEDVRRQLPGARIRLIGRSPGERTVKGRYVRATQALPGVLLVGSNALVHLAGPCLALRARTRTAGGPGARCTMGTRSRMGSTSWATCPRRDCWRR